MGTYSVYRKIFFIFSVCILIFICQNVHGAVRVEDGVQKEYYANGNLHIEKTYKDGKLNGRYRAYYKNGKLREEANYQDGQLDGVVRRYDDAGQLESETNYKEDKREGLDTLYHRDGSVDAQWNYKDDQPHGEVFIYYRNGKIHFKDTYKHGTKLTRDVFGQDGKKVSEHDYSKLYKGRLEKSSKEKHEPKKDSYR